MAKRAPAHKTLVDKLKRKDIIDKVISGYSVKQLAEDYGTTTENIYAIFGRIEDQIDAEMYPLAERVRLLSLARIERLMQEFMPDAISEKDTRKGQFVKELIKLENDIADKILPSDGRASGGNVNIEHIEVTFTGTSDMYRFAQNTMEDDWLGLSDMAVSELYEEEEVVRALPSKTEMRLEELNKEFGDLLDDEDNEEN